MSNTSAQRAVSPPGPVEVMVMRIVTRFTTVDEFVAAFRKFCSRSTCFIPSAAAKQIGVETAFSIRLADGTPMLRGLCVVLDSWPTADNPYHRPGVRLGIRSLSAESQPVFKRLVLSGATPALGNRIQRQRQIAERPTVPAAPLFAAPAEPRAQGSSFVLPANPLTELTDESLQAFVDCTISEEQRPVFDVGDGIPELLGGPEGESLGPDGIATSRISDGTPVPMPHDRTLPGPPAALPTAMVPLEPAAPVPIAGSLLDRVARRVRAWCRWLVARLRRRGT